MRWVTWYMSTFVVLREKVRAVRRVRDIDGILGRARYWCTNFQNIIFSPQSTNWRDKYK